MRTSPPTHASCAREKQGSGSRQGGAEVQLLVGPSFQPVNENPTYLCWRAKNFRALPVDSFFAGITFKTSHRGGRTSVPRYQSQTCSHKLGKVAHLLSSAPRQGPSGPREESMWTQSTRELGRLNQSTMKRQRFLQT